MKKVIFFLAMIFEFCLFYGQTPSSQLPTIVNIKKNASYDPYLSPQHLPAIILNSNGDGFGHYRFQYVNPGFVSSFVSLRFGMQGPSSMLDQSYPNVLKESGIMNPGDTVVFSVFFRVQNAFTLGLYPFSFEVSNSTGDFFSEQFIIYSGVLRETLDSIDFEIYDWTKHLVHENKPLYQIERKVNSEITVLMGELNLLNIKNKSSSSQEIEILAYDFNGVKIVSERLEMIKGQLIKRSFNRRMPRRYVLLVKDGRGNLLFMRKMIQVQ